MLCPNPECPDALETGRPGEYLRTVDVCPRCGSQLVRGPLPPQDMQIEPPAEPPLPAMPEIDLEPVFETSDPVEATMIGAFLKDEGVQVEVTGSSRVDMLSMERLAQLSGRRLIRLWVPAPFAESARELLAAFEAAGELSADEKDGD